MHFDALHVGSSRYDNRNITQSSIIPILREMHRITQTDIGHYTVKGKAPISGPHHHGRFLLMKVNNALEISPSTVNMNINLSLFPRSLKFLRHLEISSYKHFLWISHFLQMARKWYSSSAGLSEHAVHIRWFAGIGGLESSSFNG